MKKGNKKLLKVFIFVIIWVLLFSVVGVIITSLAGTTQYNTQQQAAIQEAIQQIQIDAAALSWGTVTWTWAIGNTITLTGDVAVGTGS